MTILLPVTGYRSTGFTSKKFKLKGSRTIGRLPEIFCQSLSIHPSSVEAEAYDSALSTLDLTEPFKSLIRTLLWDEVKFDNASLSRLPSVRARQSTSRGREDMLSTIPKDLSFSSHANRWKTGKIIALVVLNSAGHLDSKLP
ncbi:MAG: hypothetical protein IPN67_06430 [Bacteroidales bacterium]|nr:hypothetical protein [Bacteroidales bacterium]